MPVSEHTAQAISRHRLDTRLRYLQLLVAYPFMAIRVQEKQIGQRVRSSIDTRTDVKETPPAFLRNFPTCEIGTSSGQLTTCGGSLGLSVGGGWGSLRLPHPPPTP